MRILAAVGLLMTTCLGAQDKEAPPALGAPKPFVLPASETFTLKNGLQVTLAEYGAVPIVTVNARVEFGRANESANQVWLANLTAELMKEGTRTMDATEVANAAAQMGGQLEVNAGTDESSAGIDVLSEFAADAVKLIGDVLENPRFPASELERVRSNLLRQMTVQLSTPQAQANQAFAAHLYPGHAYGRLFPTESQLKGYGMADVRSFYTDNVGARRTHLYVVGRFDAAAVRKAAEAAFGDWREGPPVVRTPPTAEVKAALLQLDRPGAEQSTLRIGLAVGTAPGHADYIPMVVTNSLLGGAFTSRITNNIREQKGYTYSPFSQVATRYRTAHWQESADVTTKFTADSLREIVSEINRLRKEAPGERELKGIQNLLGGQFVLQNSSNSGIIGQLAFVNVHGLSTDYLTTYIQKVNAVSRQDVQRIAESYLNPSRMTLVVVGDQAKIGDSLQPYKPDAAK